ncbi:dienelactone hydrolase family protein [Lysobacter sp. K5869]|uniref:alpha/beta hydrolase family protein n=1 Tax=Lysobacter sp. K5869 TaxID=2820808 RepID=UPI001C061AC6|nr:dienelactone hydrolase family protein [Lysobacter sp. K5869]QWP78306.1 dienelactone hydrolase family protein [Lysobacter sp. K5869]
MRRATLRLPLLLTALLAACAAHADGVGLGTIETREPVTGTKVPAAVFYPSTEAGSEVSTEVGPYPIQAQRDAAPAAGRFPLIVLSHGHLGSMYGHHDLAAELARHGYIVVAPQHTGDSYDDASGAGTDRALLGRAWQASAAIDALLADKRIGAHIDAKRIGAAGFSAGGYTTLLLLGATPDFALFPKYCEQHPGMPELCDQPLPEKMQTIAHPPPTVDKRVRAGFAMAPFSILFDADSFRAMKNPVFLYIAQKDQVLAPADNGLRIRGLVPNLAGFAEVPGAGHYVFLPPCSAGFAKEVPVICTDAPGVDRAAAHREINAAAVKFFDAQFKGGGHTKPKR